MKKKEIIDILKNFGLTEYESRVYSTLVFSGISKAGIISKESEVPQSKIYSVLESLIFKQLVEKIDGRPQEFKAIAPKIALNNLLIEQERKIDSLKLKIDELSEFLRPLKPTENVMNGIWTTKGKGWKEFFNRVSEMLERSQKYVIAISRDFSRSIELSDALKSCYKRGVDIKLMGMRKIDESNYYKAKWYQNYGIPIRIFETKVHPRMVVMDGKEILLRLDNDPLKKDKFTFNSIWSADPSIVKIFDTYLKNIWKIAKPVNFDLLEKNLTLKSNSEIR